LVTLLPNHLRKKQMRYLEFPRLCAFGTSARSTPSFTIAANQYDVVIACEAKRIGSVRRAFRLCIVERVVEVTPLSCALDDQRHAIQSGTQVRRPRPPHPTEHPHCDGDC
jgi:hypothetical protein